MKFKLDENLPVSSAAILTSVGHDVDTVADEGLVGAPDRDVVAAATAAGRILISLDRGLGDIRAYPPGSHAGIVVLRLTDQSAAAATRAVSDLATLTNPDSLAGAVAVLQRGLLRIATHNQGTRAVSQSYRQNLPRPMLRLYAPGGGSAPVAVTRTEIGCKPCQMASSGQRFAGVTLIASASPPDHHPAAAAS